jgi:hypothetical protein
VIAVEPKKSMPPLIPLEQPRKLRRGRPRATDGPALRKKHLLVAYQYLVERRTSRDVAQEHGIDARTVRNWSKKALTYDDPEGEGLRRLVGHETIGGGEVIENA